MISAESRRNLAPFIQHANWMFWMALGFAVFTFFLLGIRVTFPFFLHNAKPVGAEPLDRLVAIVFPLAIGGMAAASYVNIRRIVASVTDDPAIFRAIMFSPLMTIGFAFLTMMVFSSF